MSDGNEPDYVDSLRGGSDYDSSEDYIDAVDAPELPRLLQFTEIFSIKSFVRDHIATREHFEEDEVAAIVESARIVGQERDGSIIFMWTERRMTADQTPRTPTAGVGVVAVENEDALSYSVTTTLAVYTQPKPTFNPLHTFEDDVNVVDASIDPTHRLLAYTRVDPIEGDLVYQTSIAEVCPSSRTFNIDGLQEDRFRKVQFLYPVDEEISYEHARSPSFLLMMIHGMGVLCIAVDTSGKQLRQPEFRVIEHNSIWYQWDPDHQLLYTAIFSESQDFPGILHFTCRHIMSQESKRKNNELTVDEVFSMDLPLAIGPDSFPCSNSYFKNPVALSLPSIDINMQVFSLLEKFTCVCLQHPLTDRKFQFFEASLPKSSTERSFNNHMAKNTRALSYSLYMLHSGFVLQGQASVSQSPLHPHRMNFINVGGLIAVYIPSQMLHLVNIGSNGDDPSHHIISDVDLSFSPILTHSSLISSAALADQSVILQPLHSYRQIDQASSILVDTSNEIIFKCSLNENSLLELFSSVFSSIQSKMSSLYVAHVVLQDKKLNRQMMEHICRTPTSLATPQYLILHLMASAFAAVSQQEKIFITKLLSPADPERQLGAIKKDQDGNRCSQIVVTWYECIFKQIQSLKDARSNAPNCPVVVKHLEALQLHMMCSHPSAQPVDLKSIPHSNTGADSKAVSSEVKSEKKGFFRDLFSRKSSSPSSASLQQLSGPSPDIAYLQQDPDVIKALTAQQQFLQMSVAGHFAQKLAGIVDQSTINRIAQRYVLALLQSSVELLSMIWSALSLPNLNIVQVSSLSSPLNTEELILFHLLEIFCMVHLNLGIPLPQGFHTLFVSLGFRSMSPFLFFQYLQSGVFVLTERFMDRILQCSSTIESEVVVELILQLPTSRQSIALAKWDHPLARELLERRNRFTQYRSKVQNKVGKGN